MIQNVVAAFIGCFTAQVVLAEVQHPSKAVRYSLAFIAGLLAAVLMALAANWALAQLAKI